MSLDNPERPVGGLAVRPPVGVELRPIGRSDLADATALARQLHGLSPLDDSELLRPRFEALLGSADVAPFMAIDALDDGHPIGLGILHFRRRLNFATFEGWISDLFVADRERGRGVGRALLDALIAEWKLRGSHRLQAKAPDGAAAVGGLYQAAGLHEWNHDFRLRPVVAPPPQQPAGGAAIRPTDVRDEGAITALVSQFGEQRTPAAERMDAVRRTFVAHLADVAANSAYSAVAERDGAVVGVYTLEWQQPFWADEIRAWLPDLIVDEAHRGQGIGRNLLGDAIAHARSAGAAQLSLESGPGREAAHGLYRSSGFAEAGRTWLLRRDAT
jgi:GNAT superfamily N-acetyltransferase